MDDPFRQPPKFGDLQGIYRGPSRPASPPPQSLPRNSGLATASLILGLLSPVFLCACGLSLFTSLGAIISGHAALVKIKHSSGRLAGQGMAITGLVFGYLFLAASIGVWVAFGPAVVEGWRNAGQTADDGEPLPDTPESRLLAAETQIMSNAEGVAFGNTPEAQKLAESYARLLQAMRALMFTEDRERAFSLTDGQFLVHCELHEDRCAFLIHVPSYRDYEEDAKTALESSAWELAQDVVEDTLEAEDSLAVGLRGAFMYGSVLVGPAGKGESSPENFERVERDELRSYFLVDESVDGEAAAEAPESVTPGPTETQIEPQPEAEERVFPAPAFGEQPAIHAQPPIHSQPAIHAQLGIVPPANPQATAVPPGVSAVPLPEDELEPVGEVVQRFPDLGWSVESLAFSPNGRYVAAGKLDQSLVVLDAETGQQAYVEPRLDALGQVQCVAFSSDGARLFAGGYRASIQAWEVDESGKLKAARTLHGHGKPVTVLATSLTSAMLASGSAGGDLLWQDFNDEAAKPQSLAAFERSVLAVHLAPSGSEAWATDGRRLVQVDLKSAQVMKQIELGHGFAHAAAFSPDGSQLAISRGSKISVRDTQSGAELVTLSAGRDVQWSLAFLPNGARLVSGGRGRVVLWSVADVKPLGAIDEGGVLYVQTLAVSKDGSLLAAIPHAAGQTLTITRLPQP